MRIAFYANHPKWGGLANNGGTRTIIKSAQMLESLGHKVDIVSKIDKFSYFNHKKPLKSVPKNYDHYIAVSILDLHNMLKYVSADKSSVWIRGYETWRASESRLKEIVNKRRRGGVKIFVNSIGLQMVYGGQVVYPGYDDIWGKIVTAPKPIGPKTTIGVLYHKKRTKGYEFFNKVVKNLNKDYRSIEAGRVPVDDYGMANIYHRCDIWFAPTSSEGLHCPPMEACLCGCLVVCSDQERNGMVRDYANRETAMVYAYGDEQSAVHSILNADYGKVQRMQQKIIRDIGTRRENMEKLIKLIGG